MIYTHRGATGWAPGLPRRLRLEAVAPLDPVGCATRVERLGHRQRVAACAEEAGDAAHAAHAVHAGVALVVPQEAADGATARVAASGHAPQLRVELDVELLVLVELVLRLRLAIEARREAEVDDAQGGGEEGGHVEAAAAQQSDCGGEPDRCGRGEAVHLGRVHLAVRAVLWLRPLPDRGGAEETHARRDGGAHA
eukprot:scaffold31002_cov68-Phaeocystis_antarctica.AAC.3